MKTTILRRNVLNMLPSGHLNLDDTAESNITCCSNGGCCRTGQFCIKHGHGCCYDDNKECDDGGCCSTGTYCVPGGCCPDGSVCTNGPGITTLANTLVPTSQAIQPNHSHSHSYQHHVNQSTLSSYDLSIAKEATSSAIQTLLSDTTTTPPSTLNTSPTASLQTTDDIPTLYIPSPSSISNLANWSYSTTNSPVLPVPLTDNEGTLKSNPGGYLPFYVLMLIMFLRRVLF